MFHRRAHHLGLAAHAIGVLDPRIIGAVGLADFTVFQEIAHHPRRCDLAGLAAQGMDLFQQGRG